MEIERPTITKWHLAPGQAKVPRHQKRTQRAIQQRREVGEIPPAGPETP